MGDADEVAQHAWTRIVEMSLARRAQGGGHKMSLWVDVEMGRPIEVEVSNACVQRDVSDCLVVWLSGCLVKKGESPLGTRSNDAELMRQVITGGVVRLARKLDLKTPLLDYTYALMRGLQVDILEQIEAKKTAAAAAAAAAAAVEEAKTA